MELKKILSQVIIECLENLDNSNYDELAPAIIIDERLNSEQLAMLENTKDIFDLWNFVESFFDAASHQFPEVCEGLSLDIARKAVENISQFFQGDVEFLSINSKKAVNIFYSQI